MNGAARQKIVLGARRGAAIGSGAVKESRKGWARSVSLVDAVVEPGGHYCRSSDAAVPPCVRIIAPRCRCSCLRGVLRGLLCGNSGNGTEERERGRGGKEQERTALFSRFPLCFDFKM